MSPDRGMTWIVEATGESAAIVRAWIRRHAIEHTLSVDEHGEEHVSFKNASVAALRDLRSRLMLGEEESEDHQR